MGPAVLTMRAVGLLPFDLFSLPTTIAHRIAGRVDGDAQDEGAHDGRPSAKRTAGDWRRRGLLDLDGGAGLLELLLELVGLVALDALLDGLGGLVDERLGLLEAQAGRGAHDLDDLDLLVAGAGEDDVDGRGLLLGRGAVAAAAGGRGGRGDGRRRDAELLLERLDALGRARARRCP